MLEQLEIRTNGSGLYEITDDVRRSVSMHVGRNTQTDGLCTVFVLHTSASLVIQENADPTARDDLNRFFARLVPEEKNFYTHSSEGTDDMPAHIRAALTATSLGIPLFRGELVLGQWQGIFLWEHRAQPHTRKIVVQITR